VIDHASISAYEAWERFALLGILPYGGDVGDQPASTVEAFELCARAAEAMDRYHQSRERAEDRKVLAQIMQASLRR
jgi:hypothetical protein